MPTLSPNGPQTTAQGDSAQKLLLLNPAATQEMLSHALLKHNIVVAGDIYMPAAIGQNLKAMLTNQADAVGSLDAIPVLPDFEEVMYVRNDSIMKEMKPLTKAIKA